MKVKYINKDSSGFFETGKIYNVFSIELSDNQKFYYIDNGTSKYIYGGNISDFEILDGNISQYWTFGINQFGDHVIGPKEVYIMEYFWSNYFDDIIEYEDVINKYFEIAKDELFNYNPEGISEEEQQKRKDAGWEFIDSEDKYL